MPRTPDKALLLALGARLRELRKAARLTQDVLASAAGIEPASLSRFERGQRGFSITTLGRLAGVLGVKLSALVDVEVPLPPPVPSLPTAQEEIGRLLASMDGARQALVLRVLREMARE